MAGSVTAFEFVNSSTAVVRAVDRALVRFRGNRDQARQLIEMFGLGDYLLELDAVSQAAGVMTARPRTSPRLSRA